MLMGMRASRPYAPALSSDLLTASALPAWLTFARAGSATYYDAAGLLQTATTDIPRFDHDPSTLAALGLLVEGAATNLAPQSESFDGSWGVANGTSAKVGINTSYPNPTGANSWFEWDPGSNGGATPGALYSYPIPFTAGTTYVLSVWARTKTGTSTMRLSQWDSVLESISSDLAISTTPTRLQFVFTAANSSANGDIAFRNNSAGNTGNVLLWGAQFETGTKATSYIANPGVTTATRAPDVPIFSSQVTTLCQAPFSAVLDLVLIRNPNTDGIILGGSFAEVSGKYQPWIYTPTAGDHAVCLDDNSSPVVLLDVAGTTFGTGGRAGISSSASNVTLAAQNLSPATGSGSLSALTPLRLGAYHDGTQPIDAYFRKVAFYRGKLPDAVLQAKTVAGAPL